MNSTKELWRDGRHWLTLLGIKIDEDYCRREITSHPDYPKLSSFIAFLDKGQFNFKAVEADLSFKNEFTYPLLAHIKQPGFQYMEIIEESKQFTEVAEVKEGWTGIVIMPKETKTWISEDYREFLRERSSGRIGTGFLFIIMLSLISISFINSISYGASLFSLMSVFGVYISLTLLKAELGMQSEAVKQFCGITGKGGCEKVLKSRYAHVIFGFTLSDFSLIYFVSQFLFFLVTFFLKTDLFLTLYLISIPTSFLVLVSLYLQKVKLKEWCMLCLLIDVVLTTQTVVAIWSLSNIGWNLNKIIEPSILMFFGMVLFLAMVVRPIKKLLISNKQLKSSSREFEKWKMDPDLFLSQWEKQQIIDVSILNNDLIIGSPDAPLLLTIGCNAYCNPCAKAHKQFDDLIDLFPELFRMQIRFLWSDIVPDDRRKIAANQILSVADSISDNQQLRLMLNDWFDWMDLSKWQMKWNPTFKQNDVGDKLKLHKDWIYNSGIIFTPTFFLNGRRIPERYTKDDIAKILPLLVDNIQAFSIKNISESRIVHDT